jgi:peptidyl-prolyl cis-trans isomerase B (cyclophilin B)
MKKCFLLLLILIVSALAISCARQKKQDKAAQAPDTAQSLSNNESLPEYAKTAAGNPIVVLKTTKGNIDIEVFERDAPNHGGNFIKLVKSGFYDGLTFHRIIPDVLVETGDPSGTGAGGPGYSLEPERTPYTNKAGYVGMIPTPGGKSNGSQLYILVADNPKLDDRTYCFGRVISGMENVLAISKAPAQKEKPIETIKIMEALLKPLISSQDSMQNDTTTKNTTR